MLLAFIVSIKFINIQHNFFVVVVVVFNIIRINKIIFLFILFRNKTKSNNVNFMIISKSNKYKSTKRLS